MPQQAATIESLGQAFEMVKAMQGDGLEWGEDYRPLARQALVGIIEGRMAEEALPSVYPAIPVQHCWAHKMRNVLGKVRKADHDAVKADLQAVMNAGNLRQTRSAARRFADRWQGAYPKAVACLRDDLDELLTCFRYTTVKERKAVRTTNAIELRFREVRRRTRPMGVFQDRTSMDRILFAVFMHENKMQGISAPFLVTQNN
jgi:transposase-like protein